MSADRYVGRMTSSSHPVVEARSLGECWFEVSRLILTEGVDATYDDQPIKEIARLTLSATSTDPSDAIIDRYGDPTWLRWMHANFFDTADVPELGNAASYATRLFDYARTGRNQIEWVIARLAADPNCKSASITTFMPLTDTSYIPCVSLLDFWIRDGAVDLVVFAHSLDFGKKAYGNLVELALLQAHVATALGREPGMQTIHVKSAHIYEPEYAEMTRFVDSDLATRA
ncbi:MAG: Thymidylate synthase [Acidimicrobiales bacterium]|nr:Thymidylate synthase [Acidimicrobiales bacterium]